MSKKMKANDVSELILERLNCAERLIRDAAIDVHRIVVEEGVEKSAAYDWGYEEAHKTAHAIIETLCRIQDNIEGKDLHNGQGKYKHSTTFKVRKALGYSYP